MQDFPDDDGRVPVWWVIAALGAALIFGLIYREATRPQPLHLEVLPPPPTATAAPTPTPPPILIHVVCEGAAGAINDTFRLPAHSRVEDALRVAGCTLDKGDTTRVNLAELLRDGDQIYLPAAGAGPRPYPVAPVTPAHQPGHPGRAGNAPRHRPDAGRAHPRMARDQWPLP